MTDQTAFLGVEESLSGRRWVGPDADTSRRAEAIAQIARVHPAIAQVLARQGVAPDAATAYLDPKLRDLMPDPLTLRDMGKAAARLVTAVQTREPVAVFADYDVDGGASAALLLTWLRDLDHAATLYIPDRIDEGYGPNEPAMAALAQDHRLIICVDCGTLSHGPVAAARGADVVILDHHLGGETLPPALAIVNPNRQDETGDLGHLCAAGVVFLCLVEANRQLRAAGMRAPDLMAMLDLVALATVADVAQLTGLNRAFVRQGLRVMAGRARPGLAALADVAGLTTPPTSHSLGYVLGPRVNAGGRIGAADLGARLLASDSAREAETIARQLHALNAERREIETTVRDAALAQAEARGIDGPLVWAAGEGWHPGVIGIVASRLKEFTNRPAVVIALDGAEGKGSARSIPGVDLGAAVQRLATEGLLIKGGGHRMAAGLTVARDKLEIAMAELGALLARQGAGNEGPRALRLDGLVMPEAAQDLGLIESLEDAGPYGAGASAPRFVLPAVALTDMRRIGTNHLRLRFRGDRGGSMAGVAFGAFDGPLGPQLEALGAGRVHLAGRLEVNDFRGQRSVQLRLDDAAIAR